MEPYLYVPPEHTTLSGPLKERLQQEWWLDVSPVSLVFATIQIIAILFIMLIVVLVVWRRTNVSIECCFCKIVSGLRCRY